MNVHKEPLDASAETGWESVIWNEDKGVIILSPIWGGALRHITEDEMNLYLSGLANPLPTGCLKTDFLFTP